MTIKDWDDPTITSADSVNASGTGGWTEMAARIYNITTTDGVVSASSGSFTSDVSASSLESSSNAPNVRFDETDTTNDNARLILSGGSFYIQTNMNDDFTGGVNGFNIDNTGKVFMNNDASVTGDFTVDTDSLFVDSANHRVGVGTISPSENLEVNGNSQFDGIMYIKTPSSNTQLRLERTGSSAGYMTLYANSALFGLVNQSGSEILVAKQNGDVGIGTISPDGKFQVESSGSQDVYFTSTGGTSTAYIQSDAVGDASLVFKQDSSNRFLLGYDYSAGGFRIYDYSLGDTALAIANGGNVGIGTANPLGIFHAVGATSRFQESATGDTIRLRPQTAGNGAIIDITNDAEDTYEPLNIYSDYTNFAAGNVGIGTTSPGNKLEIHGNTSGSIRTEINNEGTGTATLIFSQGGTYTSWLEHANTGDSLTLNNNIGTGGIAFSIANAPKVTINSSGNVGIGTTSPSYKLDVYDPSNTKQLRLTDHAGTNEWVELGYSNGDNIAEINAKIAEKNISIDLAYSNPQIRFNTNNVADAMDILENGNVGIGTTSPQRNLHVQKASSGAPYTDSNIVAVFENSTWTGIDVLGTSGGFINFGDVADENAGFITYRHTENRMDFGVNGVTTGDMFLTSTGLGIGTSSPNAKLDVVTSGSTIGQQITNSGTGKSFVINSDDVTQLSGDVDWDFINPYYGLRATLNADTIAAYSGFMFERSTTPQTNNAQLFKILSATADTSGQVINFEASNSGSTISVLRVTNAGTGFGQYIDQNGVATALYIDSKGTGAQIFPTGTGADTKGIALNNQYSTTPTATLLDLRNDGTGNGVFLDQNGDAVALYIVSDATTNKVIDVYSNAASNQPLMKLKQDNAAATGGALQLESDGGYALFIDQNDNSRAIDIDAETTTERVTSINANALTTGYGLVVESNAARSGGSLAYFGDSGSSTAPTVTIANSGTGKGLFIDYNGDGVGIDIDSEATTAPAIRWDVNNGALTGQLGDADSPTGSYKFFRNLASASTAGPVVGIAQDNSGDDQTALNIEQAGSGAAVVIDANGNRGASRYALHVDDEDTNGRGTVVIEGVSGDPLTVRSSGASSARIVVDELADTTSSHFAGLEFQDNSVFSGGLFKDGLNDMYLWVDGTKQFKWSTTGDFELLTSTGQLKLPSSNDAAAPTLAFGGDTGFYEQSDNVLIMTRAGSADWYWNSTEYGAYGGVGVALLKATATSTVPNIVPNVSDKNTGIGHAGADQLSLIAGGSEIVRVDSAGIYSSDSTRWWIRGDVEPTSTIPTFIPDRSDTDTGIGHNTANELSLIANGSESVRVTENNVNEYETATAGESVTAGNVVYLKSDGKYWKADADSEATVKGKILIATESISADATGVFLRKGIYTTTGLTTGSTYFLSATTGGYSSTAPSTTGQFIRTIGVALSTTELEFDPSKDYFEVA